MLSGPDGIGNLTCPVGLYTIASGTLSSTSMKRYLSPGGALTTIASPG